ncbi:hypothetical protein ACHAXH_008239 [Discostella pseudostelligera]
MSTQKIIAQRAATSDGDNTVNDSSSTAKTSAETEDDFTAVASADSDEKIPIIADCTSDAVDAVAVVNSAPSGISIIDELASKNKTAPLEGIGESPFSIDNEIHTSTDVTEATKVSAVGNASEGNPADSQNSDSNKPSTRSRTRSLSSALSSQSGGDSLGGDDSMDPILFDDDGKTPLRTNRMSSRGPVRKRHRNEGPRALFRTNSSATKSSQAKIAAAADSKEDVLPPFENYSTSSSISLTACTQTRERSNTIESFRAAMDSHLNNEIPTESIVLPGLNRDDAKIGDSDNHYFPVPGRDRSDTIDFLTSAVEFQLDGDTSNNLDEIQLSPIGSTKEHAIDKPPATVVKKVAINYQTQNVPKSGTRSTKGGKGGAYADGKTPKITNRLRATSQSSESTSQGPLRKRYRTRSLSFALLQEEEASLDKNHQRDGPENFFHSADGMDDDDILAETGSGYDTFDIFGRRSRSDTLDFLTAAVAGDLGHDLDAAAAAAANDGATFTTHHVSAPSGASTKYNPLLPKRPRSDTLDSTASSINSAKLDFFVSVAAEHGLLLSPDHNGGKMGREGAESMASDHSSEYSQRRPRSNTLEIYSNMASARARSNTVEFLIGSTELPEGSIDDLILPDNIEDHNANSNVLDHLKALCDDPKGSEAKSTKILRFKRHLSSDVMDGLSSLKTKSDEGSSVGKKLRKSPESGRRLSNSQDSFSNSMSRNRLESWGGMSDLSTGAMGSSAIAATHMALKDTGILDDVLAAAADLGYDDLSEGVASFERMRDNRSASVGSNSLSMQKGRQRLDSLASLSLASLSDTSTSKPANTKTPATKSAKGNVQHRIVKPSDVSSVGAASIVVDYDAIASAVHAANAATDGLDLNTILGKPCASKPTNHIIDSTTKTIKGGKVKDQLVFSRPSQHATPLPKKAPVTSKDPSSNAKNPPRLHNKSQPKPFVASTKVTPQLFSATPEPIVSGSLLGLPTKPPTSFPVSSINIPLVPIPTCTKTKEEMEARQERARAAAGYVPPGLDGKTPLKRPPPPRPMQVTSSISLTVQPGVPTRIPIKKRGVAPLPPFIPMPDHVHSQDFQTAHSHIKPAPVPSSAPSSKAGTLQSQQKWDDMFECLVKFIEETREKATKNLTDEQKAAWIWDGNVPTSHKTSCGKALGRWINNQRSAKAKGALKDDREVRLVSTGLKWSVLTTNSWRQMLRELEIYVNEQTKDGQIWDGNVPTNYKIKSNIPTYNTDDEEKNLGRWVNRQRSLFQAGKLKKDRQQDLERIGLKWSVLLTTSWTTMYDSLCAYAEEKRKQSPHGWDGNVPANFKTRSNPSLSLGRWVNRQRSAHAKGRLKDEYVKQLDAIGLKWAIHTRNRTNEEGDVDDDDEIDDDDDDDFVGGEFIEVDTKNVDDVAQGSVVVASKPNGAQDSQTLS